MYATAAYEGACITLQAGSEVIFSTVANLSPEHIFTQTILLPSQAGNQKIKALVRDKNGRRLVDFEQLDAQEQAVPPPAAPAPAPEEIESNELLFLNGLHLEQYRHATYSPVDYYAEALKRDAYDVRCNNAMGLWLMRKAKFAAAEPYFRRAIQRLVTRNPNPPDGEAYYNLGLCLLFQEKVTDAYAAFYKSTWNDACQHKAFFQLARIEVRQRNYAEALDLLEKSLARNGHNPRAHHLLAIVYRKLGQGGRALEAAEKSIVNDPFNYGCLMEKYLLLQSSGSPEAAAQTRQHLGGLMRQDSNNYLEYALDYLHAGQYNEACQLLASCLPGNDAPHASPLLYYYLAWLHCQLGKAAMASHYYQLAYAANPDYCFPHKVEDVAILEVAMGHNPADYKAPHYLGNFWYAHGQYKEAVACWEKSVAIYDRFPTAQRNLSLAYFNQLGQAGKALHRLERAFELDQTDARVFMELDQLYKLTNKDSWQRLQLLEDHLLLVEQRDDLYLERITLYNQLGDYETARALLEERRFHPWEGGEGKVAKQFLVSQLGLAKQALEAGEYGQALALLQATDHYPDNLCEGKLPGTPENEINYLKALTYRCLGMHEKANALFRQATAGDAVPMQAIFYNDPQPDNIFYQGLSWLQLGEKEKASLLFNRLIQFGESHLQDTVRIDYFAVSLPELLVFNQDLNKKNRVHCQYLIGLGLLGLASYRQASEAFNAVLQADGNHQGALIHLHMIAFLGNYENFEKSLGQAQSS